MSLTFCCIKDYMARQKFLEIFYSLTSLKGPCHEIFDLRFFSSNNSIWATDPYAYGFEFADILD
jgi:hypothetical protein